MTDDLVTRANIQRDQTKEQVRQLTQMSCSFQDATAECNTCAIVVCDY